MTEYLLAIEPALRLYAFLGVFVAMALWEITAPKRVLVAPKIWRWFLNLTIVALDAAILRLLFPILAVGMALYAAEQGIGLLNWLTLPAWIAIPVAFVALDLVIYFQHAAFHRFAPLWRMHRVHHADPDFDVTTGARFHPFEIVLSMLIKFAVVLALGAPAASVLLFEVMLNATAMFNHANARLPAGIDRVLRQFVVTPDMHRVHHSIVPAETNANYGFNLPWWDRLFGTYRDQPAAGHLAMTIGLPEFQEARRQGLIWLLLLPFDRALPPQVGGAPSKQ